MTGQLPPIPPQPTLPQEPLGLFARIKNALFPAAPPPAAGEQAPAPSPNDRAAGRLSTLPRRVAIFVAVVLVAIVIGCWLEFRTNPYHVPWRYSLTPLRGLSVLLLLMVIPVSVYQALKLWFQGEKSQFPDIDAAWQAGKEALRKQGLSLGDKPVFLVLGSTGEDQERALFEASKSPVLVRGVPEGPAPLHWYVNNDRIFLSCTGASWLTALSDLLARRGKRTGQNAGRSPAGRPAGTADLDRISATIQPTAFLRDEGPAGATVMPLSKSMKFTPSASSVGTQTPAGARPSNEDSSATLYGNRSPAFEEESPAIIPPSDAAEQEDRLQAVCELLRTARYPYSPINGCIMLVPFGVASATSQEIEELSKAINTDLVTMHNTLQVCYPVTAIFTGMDEEPGFRELMRRVGPEGCATNRFGMGYDLRSPASSGEIGNFAGHVCGVFEDWVYGLFREDQVLKRPGNSYLFSLLCRIRSSFKDRLSELLSQGFGYNDRLKPEEAPFLFSGCYFVASGNARDHRAFIQGIAEKLDGEQDRMEWSAPAIAADRRARRLGIFAVVMIALLAIHLIAMAIMHPPWGQ